MILIASLTDKNNILNPTIIPNSHIASIINILIPAAAKMADEAENINKINKMNYKHMYFFSLFCIF